MNASDTNNQHKPKPKFKRRRLSSNAWIIIVVSALIAGFVIYGVFNYFQIIDDTVEVGAKGEAKTNPYFALQNFLTASGATVALSNKTAELEKILAVAPATRVEKNNVLLLGDRRLAEMRPERVDKIVEWVAAGGHLIVEAEQYYLADPLLARWGIGVKQLVFRNGKYVERETPLEGEDEGAASTSGEDIENESADAQPPQKNTTGRELGEQTTPDKPRQPSERTKPSKPSKPSNSAFDLLAEKMALKKLPTTIMLADGVPFQVSFQPYQNVVLTSKNKSDLTASPAPVNKIIASDDIALIRDRDGGRMVEFTHGQGRVTVLSNFDLMTFKNLGEFDHAELIWHLVASENTAAPNIILALNRQGEGFLSWMLQHAWMVAVSAITLLLLWLWRVIPRMGPLAAPNPIARRSLVEHIVATGAYLVKQKQWQSLVEPLRLKFMVAFKARHPRVISMSESEMLLYAARQLQVDENALARALFVPVSSFTETLGVINQLRQLLLKINATTISNNGQRNE